MPKTVVFTTSDIQLPWTDSALEPCSRAEDGTKFYSTHKLEAALHAGFTVYVITTRNSFGVHDNWWRKLVPADHVIITNYSGGGAQDEATIATWRRLYTLLGHNPDSVILGWQGPEMEPFAKYHGKDEPRWMDYQNALNQIGVLNGQDFKRFGGNHPQYWPGL